MARISLKRSWNLSKGRSYDNRSLVRGGFARQLAAGDSGHDGATQRQQK